MLFPGGISPQNHRLSTQDPSSFPSEAAPELQDLYALAQWEMERGHLEGAGALWAHLSRTSVASPALRDRAQNQLDALRGQGGLNAARAEFLSNQFISQVFDPAGLGAMIGAGLTYQLARLGIFGAAGRFGLSGSWLRPTAALMAFSLEAGAFPLYGNLGNLALGREVAWNQFSEQVASSFFILGGLKLFGHLGSQAFRSVQASRSPLGRGLIHQGSMYLGILSGHGAEQLFGLAPRQGVGQLLGESLGTLIHFNAAGRLIPYLAGPRVQSFERGLELAWHSRATDNHRLGYETLVRSADLGRLELPQKPKSRNPFVALTALGMGLSTLLAQRIVYAQESISQPFRFAGSDLPLEWICGVGALSLLGSLALRSYIRNRFQRQVERARQNPQYLLEVLDKAPDRAWSLFILLELAQRNPDAIRALNDLAERALIEDPNGHPTARIFNHLRNFDLGILPELAHTDHRALEALRVLASEPYHNQQAFQAIQRIPLKSMEAFIPRARQEMEVAYLFWQIARKLMLPNAWGVVFELDWHQIFARAPQDWRAAEMAIPHVFRNKEITMRDLQSLNLEELWGNTPPTEQAHVIVKVLDPLAMYGNPEAEELIHSLSPERLARELLPNKKFFEALGVLGEYGTRHAADVLAQFGETNIRALTQLVRMASYGDLIAGNLLRSLGTRAYEGDMEENIFSLSALQLLSRQKNPSALHALERYYLLNPEGPEIPEIAIHDINVSSPKHSLRKECQFYLDDFSGLIEAQQIQSVNDIWRGWYSLSPEEKLDYYRRDREEGTLNPIPIQFLLENIHPEGG